MLLYLLLFHYHSAYFIMLDSADLDLEDSPKVPCILHMDSIKGSHAGLKNLVQRYVSSLPAMLQFGHLISVSSSFDSIAYRSFIYVSPLPNEMIIFFLFDVVFTLFVEENVVAPFSDPYE